MRKHYRDEKSPHPPEDLMHSVSAQLDNVGLGDPARKIYITARNVRYFPLISFLFTICNVSKIVFPDANGKLKFFKKKDCLFDLDFRNSFCEKVFGFGGRCVVYNGLAYAHVAISSRCEGSVFDVHGAVCQISDCGSK